MTLYHPEISSCGARGGPGGIEPGPARGGEGRGEVAFPF